MVAAVATLIVAQSSASAQTPQAGEPQEAAKQDDALSRAKELFRKAEVQFGLGNFEAALELYQRAYEAKKLPAFHFNMGQCHRNLKRYEKAIFHFRQFLAQTTNEQHRVRGEDLLQDCRQKLKAQRAAASAAKDAKPASEPTTRPAEGRSGRRGLSKVYFWVGVGLTGALVATGTITGAMALSKSLTYRDSSTPPADRPDLKDSGEALRTAANISFGAAAGAAVLTGILLYFTDFGGSDETVRAGPTNDGAMLTLTRRF